ncbi:MAG: CAP domain-containing protein [Gemmatimonadota bacterium]
MRLRARRLLAAAAAAVSFGCVVPAPGGAPAAPPGPQPPAAGGSALAEAVVNESNRTRAAHGVRVLAMDEALNEAAQGHAEELAARRTLDHRSITPGRTTMSERIRAAGGTWVRAAENLANMSGPASNVPAQTIDLWLSSTGHRRNLLEPAYTHTGTGVAADARGVWYVVQLYTVPAP